MKNQVKLLLFGKKGRLMICVKLLFLFIMVPSCAPPPGSYVEGALSAYSQSPTDATLKYRIEETNQISPDAHYDVLVAVRDCGRIGQYADLNTRKGRYLALVFDCAGIEDGGAEWMDNGGYVAEVDYYFWQEHPDLIGTKASLEYWE